MCLTVVCSRLPLKLTAQNATRIYSLINIVVYRRYFFRDQGLQTNDTSSNAVRNALFNVGINTDLVSDRWFINHSRWIIWKLVSSAGYKTAGKYLAYDTRRAK
jgi:hypothetical protein